MFKIFFLFYMMATIAHSQTSVLIVGRSWENEFNNWVRVLESLGDVSVTISERTPSNVDNYDQIWYADFQNWNRNGTGDGSFVEPSDIAISTILPKYLENGGNIAFLTDHSSKGEYLAPRKFQDQIERFIREVTPSPFRIGNGVKWGPDNLIVNIDERFGVSKDLKNKLEDPSKNYSVTAYAYVEEKDLGTGLGILYTEIVETISWWPKVEELVKSYVGIAFVGDSFHPWYQNGGRVFVFTDIFNALNAGASGNTRDNDDLLELIINISGGRDITRPSIRLDTMGVNIPSGQTVFYEPSLKEAQIVTHPQASISFSVNGDSPKSIGQGSAMISLEDFPEEAELEVIIEGETDRIIIAETKERWTFIRKKSGDLNLFWEDSIISDGSRIEYRGESIPLKLKTENGEQIVYRFNSGEEIKIDGKEALLDLSDLPDSLELKASVMGESIISKTKQWRLIRKLPNAFLKINDIEYSSSIEEAQKNIFTTPSYKIELKVFDEYGNQIDVDKGSLLISHKGSSPMDNGTPYSEPFNISTSDTIRVAGQVEGYELILPAYWIFIQDLPLSKLIAEPGNFGDTLVFTTEELKVNLYMEDISGNILEDISIYYTLNGEDPLTDGLLYTKPIVINEDLTHLKAVGIKEGYRDSFREWFYLKDLPKAKLSATPSNNPSFEFDTRTLQITVETDASHLSYRVLTLDNQLIKEVDREEVNSIDITIEGSVRVEATASGRGFITTTESWVYISNLPSLTLKADPSGGSFEIDTTIYLHAKFEDQIISDAQIRYSIGGASYSEDNSKEYDSKKGITINNSATIFAKATHEDYLDAFNSWTYTLQLRESWITANPADEPYLSFGRSIPTVTLETNAPKLEWRVASGEWKVGDEINLSNFIREDNSTVTIYGRGSGAGYETIEREWVYKQQTLPSLIATPGGRKFTDSIKVLLKLKDDDNNFENVRIFYTLDGSEPTEESYIYSDQISIKKTTNLKAVAFADNALKSPVLTEKYIRANSVIDAVYLDTRGDGAINAVNLFFANPIEMMPSKVEIRDPFSDDLRSFSASEMQTVSNSEIFIEFPPFHYNNIEGTTYFKSSDYGAIFGSHYIEGSFTIRDSVAPLLQLAEYRYGELSLSSMGEVIKSPDTLRVTFSEPVSFKDGELLFDLIGNTDYSMITGPEFIKESSRTFRFVNIKEIVNNRYPENGDSIRFNINNRLKAESSGSLQDNRDHIYGLLRVLPQRHLFTIRAITPVDPENFIIPKELKTSCWVSETGFVIRGDFHTPINDYYQIRAKAFILDAVGNRVTHSSGCNSTGLSIDIQQNETTQVLINWNGRNSNGRLVGSGSYSFIISIDLPNSDPVEKTVILGVQRDLAN